MVTWFRKCQECGHVQEAKPPAEYKGEAWRDVACCKCKSIALDYGSTTDPRKPIEDWK